jgi:UDP-N-acetylmuramoyl-tripeptide--D-alanyl-D-alanine ligase
MKIAAGWRGPRLTFGLGEACQVRAEDVRSKGFEGLEFDLVYEKEKSPVGFPFLNEAYVLDLLAAAAVCLALGLSLEEIRPRIASLRPFSMRGVLVELEGGIRLYDDSYNSNPRALEAALKSLGALQAARKVAVLADMLELGEDEREFHRQAGAAVVRWGWDVLVAVGPLAAHIAEEAATSGMPEQKIFTFPDSTAAAARINEIIRKGDLILVKGSRSMRTDLVVEILKSRGKE